MDESVSWVVARDLSAEGHDAVHVRDVGLARATDERILQQALRDDRTIITQDTDFGTLLADRSASLPSVILFRGRDGRPDHQSRTLLTHLKSFQNALESGAIVVIGDRSVRIRRLPLGS